MAIKGIANRSAHAEQVAGPKPSVILHVVIVNLGADKEVVPSVIADASAQMFHQVIAAGVAWARPAGAGRVSRQVETVARDAETAHEVQTKILSHLWLEEGVDVGQNWTVFFRSIVVGLFYPPRCFQVEAYTLSQKNVGAYAGVGPARLPGRHKRQRGRVVLRCEESVGANRDVNLLAVSNGG